ncbi:GyrI-like domain-containing protein [Candidatus Bealeia paramacronuclearis]|uniref:GyrI-like domain-containing protein n=1 Tax=Candidatus Bealeia paramacronuclearis TaxID=1921001 RepID=A0ABZ2C4F2_9PROT|nr:GyrI-like domain-containing protein [Candidatus Bealeia paramacronuclearis]
MSLQKSIVTLAPKKVIGLEVRTSFQNECNPLTAKISPLIGRYFQEGVSQKIQDKTAPGVMIAGYKTYDLSFQRGAAGYEGPYTYFIGDEASSLESVSEGLITTEIPGGVYVKFTTSPGPMPLIIIHAWQEIWQMSEGDLGGKRTWGVDFEVYDERAQNPMAAVIDIYVGTEAS